MAAVAVHAGLLREGQVERHMEGKVRAAEQTYMQQLEEREKIKAGEFLRKARQAAAEQWSSMVNGRGSGAIRAPEADATESVERSGGGLCL